MSNRITRTTAALALGLVALATPAFADEIVGAKTVGAMTFETRGVATNAMQVGRQGGFATAGTVRWTATPAEQTAAVIHNAGSVGALTLETLGLATNAGDVRNQGGARTAAAVRWTSAPAE
ncbi:hypothetical protein [Methylobacterium brachythecii]|uniref:Uncharacterized protein n=1 Tax=Methylobacterium brachythecii TaxID=1176177 RepID=A0A7W6AH83_9HYPH|nr:hypothetical protein [Methylobacterium brachythecii]MBB3901410.1 hypothetical protein [Methylobacterium brachythecii]GLS42984.1 hypothetical protein GCM10007884_09690 [Methylobacterium brachythecii]